ncbi:MAG: hypothetical protein ACWGN7_00135 [Thermodesulfovibrionales bacterium]
MQKKIAVLVRDRQGEALRVSVGITIMDDMIDVYVLDRRLAENEENAMNLEALKDLGMRVYTNVKDNAGIEYVPTEEIASRLLEYDTVLPY